MRRSQRPIVTKKPQPAAESKPNDRRQSLRLNHGPSSVEMKRDTDDNRNEGDCECDMGVCDEPVVNTPDAPVEKAPVETAPVEKATTTINVDDVDNFTEPAANRTYKLSKIPDDVYFGEVTGRQPNWTHWLLPIHTCFPSTAQCHCTSCTPTTVTRPTTTWLSPAAMPFCWRCHRSGPVGAGVAVSAAVRLASARRLRRQRCPSSSPRLHCFLANGNCWVYFERIIY